MIRQRQIISLILIPVCILSALLSGCSKKVMHVSDSMQNLSGAPQKFYQFEDAQSPPAEVMKSERLARAPALGKSRSMHTEGMGSGDAVAESEPASSAPAKRMVAREGFLETRSTQPDSILLVAIALVEANGGYLESRTNSFAVLRVPVDSFQRVFDTLLTFGQALSHRITAEDITDAFADAEARIAVLQKTIERYTRLVVLAKEEAEKLRLLREIETLRTQLEELEMQKTVLSSRAAFSRIHLSVQGMAAIVRHLPPNEIRGFEWIRTLDPHSVRIQGATLRISVPDGMVRVRRTGLWLAEAAGGTRVWTARIDNNPRGDTRFWVRAILDRIGTDYASVDTSVLGSYTVIRLTPFPGSHYFYEVAVRAYNRRVELVQIYYPGPDHEQRFRKAVDTVLRREDL